MSNPLFSPYFFLSHSGEHHQYIPIQEYSHLLLALCFQPWPSCNVPGSGPQIHMNSDLLSVCRDSITITCITHYRMRCELPGGHSGRSLAASSVVPGGTWYVSFLMCTMTSLNTRTAEYGRRHVSTWHDIPRSTRSNHGGLQWHTSSL